MKIETLAGGRIKRQNAQEAPQQEMPQESSIGGVSGKIARPLAKFGAAALGGAQDAYQTLEGIVSNPSVQKAIVGPASGLIDLLPGGKLPIPERIPFLPNSTELKQKAKESGEPLFGKGFLEPKGFIEKSIDKTAEFLPAALLTATTLGGSLLGAARGALGSGVGAQALGQYFGVPGEFVGSIIGDIALKNPKALANLSINQIPKYLSKKKDEFWKKSQKGANKIKVPKNTLKKITDPIYAEEIKLTTDHPVIEKRDAETKATINMLQEVNEKIKNGGDRLTGLMDARKFINGYFKKNITPYQKERAEYAHKIVREGIDSVLAKSPKRAQLAKEYNLANVLTETVKRSERIEDSLAKSGVLGQLKDSKLGTLAGIVYGIPKLISNPRATLTGAAVGSYVGKKVAPIYPFIDKRLFPLLTELTDVIEKQPFNKEMIAKTVRILTQKAKALEKQDKVESKNPKKQQIETLAGGRIKRP